MLDIKLLAQKLEFDIEDVLMLLELFLESSQSSLANIEDALELNRLEIVAQEAHSIKGSAANLLLADIVNKARDLEDASKEEQKMKSLTLFKELEMMIEKVGEVGYSYA